MQLQIGLNLNERKYSVLADDFKKLEFECDQTTAKFNELKDHSEKEEERLNKDATEWRLKYRSTQCAAEL